jgi:hypothetical protein
MLLGAAAMAAPAGPLVVTASNDATANQLLVYNTRGALLQTIPTQGKGGVGGNSGGVAAHDGMVAAVNFGSNSVTLFERGRDGMRATQVVAVAAAPVSVAFGHGHLYILETTQVESHAVRGNHANPVPDGVAPLLHADGSAGQVGVLAGQLIITEKSNVVETVDLDAGAVNGLPTAVANMPANIDTPLGLVTRGNKAYVTIAHADEIALVRDGGVVTVTPSVTQHAPCWVTLVGPYLFSANTPSSSVSRYAVYGSKIVQEAPVAAHFNGGPTDIDSTDGLVAVIDFSAPVTHLSILRVNDDGDLSLKSVATINAHANGVAFVD